MPYRSKLKREAKSLGLENAQLKLKIIDLTKLFIKFDLLPKIAMTECLCNGTKPPCGRCAARNILKEAGFNLKEEKPKPNIILPTPIIKFSK